jgi:hypothetical protein
MIAESQRSASTGQLRARKEESESGVQKRNVRDATVEREAAGAQTEIGRIKTFRLKAAEFRNSYHPSDLRRTGDSAC